MAVVAHVKHLKDRLAYRLVRPLAEGGMGIVYEAEQQGAGGFRKRVAIKIIREEYSAVPEFRKNFVGEARLVANLIHTNIVQTYHLGEILGQYYMVMEYVSGVNLEEFILQHRALGQAIPVDLAAFIVSRVCRGLRYAHTKTGDDDEENLGIVHRDVNPRNILIAYEGDVKLTDFGIAKAVNIMYNKEGDVIAGKDEYLSPEQARREVTDARADIFSCGVVLLEMICGTNIFEAETGARTRHNIQHMPLPRIAEYNRFCDRRLEAILQRSLARTREERYQTAQEMLTALELYLYSDGYGPTNEKLAGYLEQLFAEGKAYEDDVSRRPGSFGLSAPRAR
ncbi:MAG: serine/threonine protein kinase bacterial [Puniceicoccaceae bacterium 5H]|nr:MAG: serine/threonine protein kinase bacterial [Puniceicoccaceae bacterium 5H]